MNTYKTLEFDIILDTLSDLALSKKAKDRLLSLKPSLSEKECKTNMEETTQAKTLLETLGNPPISFMVDLGKIFELSQNGSMLSAQELSEVARFIHSCLQMKNYLKRGEELNIPLAHYGNSFFELKELEKEINTAIKGSKVDYNATSTLRNIERKITNAHTNIKLKLESILRGKKDCFSDFHIVTRNNRLVLPVKKTHKGQISGTVVDSSSTGATVFIEPASVRKLQEELSYLEIEEENEIRKILYTLTALVEDNISSLRVNMECMELMDFAFAKAKLSDKMGARQVELNTQGKIIIKQGRHPLLSNPVPLDFQVGGEIKGVVITGPNTGGKTVSIKTVGLLSLMAQCGLHVPVEEGSVFALRSNVLCDIGDGQSITENLSTFSSHIKNIVEIINHVNQESLVILDELGSGTDPTEGMGIAVAILEELRNKNCLFVATTHYPEIKDYARQTPSLINARMDFDKENLKPLYKLQIGEAGVSCAFHIAQKLGFPLHMLNRAQREVYGKSEKPKETIKTPQEHSTYDGNLISHEVQQPQISKTILPTVEKEKEKKLPKSTFVMGDSVRVQPENLIGIVYKTEDDMGNLIVQIQGVKKSVSYKRLTLVAKAEDLYPPDYDFTVIFNTMEERRNIRKGYKF